MSATGELLDDGGEDVRWGVDGAGEVADAVAVPDVEQLLADLVQDQAEEVGEGEEGKVGFGLGGGAAQHGPDRGAVFGGQCPQNGGLSNSGGPVEQDTAAPGQLIARGGLYRRLWELQRMESGERQRIT